MSNTPLPQSVPTPTTLATYIDPMTIIIDVFYRVFCGTPPTYSDYDAHVQSVPTYKVVEMIRDSALYGQRKAAVTMLLGSLPDDMIRDQMVLARDTRYIVEHIITNWPDWAPSPVCDYDRSTEWWMRNIHDPSERIFEEILEHDM